MKTQLLTQTEKTIAVLDEYEAWVNRMEKKYDVTIVGNIDKVKDNREKKAKNKGKK